MASDVPVVNILSSDSDADDEPTPASPLATRKRPRATSPRAAAAAFSPSASPRRRTPSPIEGRRDAPSPRKQQRRSSLAGGGAPTWPGCSSAASPQNVSDSASREDETPNNEENAHYLEQRENYESGKIALESIVAEIDQGIAENGSVGGLLLSSFADKKLTYTIKPNKFSGSILWKMEVPKTDQAPASVSEVPYILFVLQADEFCRRISDGSLLDHIVKVRKCYPSFTICYVTNKLMKYIKERDRDQYNNPSSSNSWTRPPVEEIICKLATHYMRVHSRQCKHEAEVAEHVVRLTCSLAKCKFRKQLTCLSVRAGGIIPKGCIERDLFMNNNWLRSLIAIPKVQPKFAIAIWKEYHTMRSLLNLYMDPSKTDREKELLLKDLKYEGPLGDAIRRLGPACSKRVFRVLMAQNGALGVEDVM